MKYERICPQCRGIVHIDRYAWQEKGGRRKKAFCSLKCLRQYYSQKIYSRDYGEKNSIDKCVDEFIRGFYSELKGGVYHSSGFIPER